MKGVLPVTVMLAMFSLCKIDCVKIYCLPVEGCCVQFCRPRKIVNLGVAAKTCGSISRLEMATYVCKGSFKISDYM